MYSKQFLCLCLLVVCSLSITCSMCGTKDCCKSDVCSIHCRQMGKSGGSCSYSAREDRCICYCYSNKRNYVIESSDNFKNASSCKADECFYDNKCYNFGDPLYMNEESIIKCNSTLLKKPINLLSEPGSYCNSRPCDSFCSITCPKGRAAYCSCQAYGPYDPYIPRRTNGICYCAGSK